MTDTNTENKGIECPECSGFGRIGDGPFTMGVECPKCGGTGACNVSIATEKVVRDALDKASAKTGANYPEHLVSMLLVTIDGPDALVQHGGDDKETGYLEPSSLAAAKVNSRLWSSFPSETASRITCDLYFALGRESELGWILECVPDYRFEG